MGLEKLNNDIFQASKEDDHKREDDLKEVRERIRLEIRDYVEHQLKLLALIAIPSSKILKPSLIIGYKHLSRISSLLISLLLI